jgi:hypothetical protein
MPNVKPVQKKKRSDTPLTILVSSSVYGIEELLERIYAILTGYGYEVWMSHKGTLPVLPDRSNKTNCLDAVAKCDLFLGLITARYGSSKKTGERSITHEELLKAIELGKPRWILAHNNVIFARNLLNNLGYDNPKKRSKLTLSPTPIIDDLRVIDMYEAAILHDITIKDRKGNWVQPFHSINEAQLFAGAQFYRYQEVEDFIFSHHGNRSELLARISREVRS